MIAYFTICATAWVSPPPSCVRDFVDPTSQHFAELAALVVCGKIMMKPYWSAAATIPPDWAWPNTADALPPQKCDTTKIGGLAAGLSGT